MFKLVLAICLLSPLAFAGGKEFLDITFEEALKRAGAENKVVYVDFYTTWCGPCKMMDRTTFKDEKVLAWLKEHAIPLAIDAEAQVDLAKKYDVKMYPTSVFIKANGSVAYRFSGYRDPQEFLTECAQSLSGKSSDQIAREALAADPNNGKLKFELVQKLVEAGKGDEAVDLIKTVLADSQQGKDQGMPVSMFYMMLDRCRTPASKSLLAAEYERIHGTISAGQIELEAVRNLSMLASMDKKKSILKVYDELKAAGTAAEKLALFNDVVYKDMLDAGRYAELEAMKSVDTRLAELDARSEQLKSAPAKQQEMMAEFLTYQKIDLFKLMLGLGKQEQAHQLADGILAKSPSYDTFNALAWTAYEAKHCDQLTLDWAKKAYELAGPDNASVLDTYARVMAVMGQREPALQLVKDAMTRVGEKGRERDILNELMQDLTNEPVKEPKGN